MSFVDSVAGEGVAGYIPGLNGVATTVKVADNALANAVGKEQYNTSLDALSWAGSIRIAMNPFFPLVINYAAIEVGLFIIIILICLAFKLGTASIPIAMIGSIVLTILIAHKLITLYEKYVWGIKPRE